MSDFIGFPKIPRLFRDIVITEKIDGTNGQIVIDLLPATIDQWEEENGVPLFYTYHGDTKVAVRACSRSRFITPEKDNYGFAKWVMDHGCDLAEKLGPGRHFGEWWGQGIQRGYGLKEKRFSLFNVAKWGDASVRPACCSVVPVLWQGPFCTQDIFSVMAELAINGSLAAPGFMKPEGVVIFHKAGGVLFKATLENDEKPKGQTE